MSNVERDGITQRVALERDGRWMIFIAGQMLWTILSYSNSLPLLLHVSPPPGRVHSLLGSLFAMNFLFIWLNKWWVVWVDRRNVLV